MNKLKILVASTPSPKNRLPIPILFPLLTLFTLFTLCTYTTLLAQSPNPSPQPPQGSPSNSTVATAPINSIRIQPKTDDLNQAKQVYEERCAQCHGQEGKGNGNLSDHLQPRPRNFQSKDWQKQISDQDIKRIIIGGGGAVQKSVLMPANPDLRSKPRLIEALIYLIRTFDLSNQLDESQLPLNQPTEE